MRVARRYVDSGRNGSSGRRSDLATRLRAMSMQVCGSDPRTFGQRRADALIALAEGKTSLDCQCDGDCTRRDDTKTSALPIATILVGVNASTLLGFDDLPGYLQGHGHIDADLARAIAADATWQRVLTLAPSEVQHCSTAGQSDRCSAWVGRCAHRRYCPLRQGIIAREGTVVRGAVNPRTSRPRRW